MTTSNLQSQSNLSQAQLRLQVLELARDLLHNTYVDQKAHRHNEWSASAEIAWKSQGVKLPYPPFPPYFDEKDVIDKASKLLAFVLDQSSTPCAPVEDHKAEVDVAPQSQEESSKEQLQQETVPLPPAPMIELVQPSSYEVAVAAPALQPLREEILSPPASEPKGLKVFGNWRRS